MKKTLLALAALGALALTACSSDDTPDATPGEGDANPQVTDTATPGDEPNGDPGGLDDNWTNVGFCQALYDTSDLGDDLDTSMDELNALMEDSENWDSPETMAALHAQGQAMLDFSDGMMALYREAAGEVGDPEVSAALNAMADYFDLLFGAMGQAAIEADSMMNYLMNVGTAIDTEEINALTDSFYDATAVVSDYAYEVCGSAY